MKPVFVVLLLIFFAPVKSSGQTSAELFQKLDKVLEQADSYIDKKEQKLTTLKDLLCHANNIDGIYNYSSILAEEYKAYNNDSALHYLHRCLDIAKAQNRKDWLGHTNIRLINQYTVSGYYDDASYYASVVDTTGMSREMIANYLLYQNNLQNEQAFYSKDDSIAQRHWREAGQYRTQLLRIVDENSVLYYQQMMMRALGKQEYDSAKKFSDLWLKSINEDDAKYATMAYYRAELYGHLGDNEQRKCWFIRSAIKDIESAIMDQASLWSLAQILNEEGETKKSYQYIKYSWDCISRFSIHMRGWQVMPVMQGIEANYKQVEESSHTLIVVGLVLVSILSVLLIISLYLTRKRNLQLSASRNEMDTLNQKLSQINNELSVKNTLLEDSNMVKEKYIGDFINLCTQYIEKLDAFRVKVNRKLRAGQINEILTLTDNEKLKKKELEELHLQFDTTFLALFPSFIDDFNKLLLEDSRITIKEKGRLNTNLRIFALIRLGIDDSANIAAFLHYTPNSIYCYRARLKNKALGNRDEFEDKVKSIGIITINEDTI